MNIAIIGAGNVAQTLARASLRAGHTVTLGSRNRDHAREAAEATGAHAATSLRETAQAADLIVFAVPYRAVEGILAAVGDAVDGKTLVDASNPVNADLSGLVTGEISGAETVQALAPSAHVVKAFNSILVARQSGAPVDGVVLDGFVAADDASAKAAVLELVGSMGFKPLDAGSLSMARALEAMALLNMRMQILHGWSWQSAWKLVGVAGG